MGFIIGYKCGDKSFLAADTLKIISYSQIHDINSRQSKIQKFKNVVIAYVGEYKLFYNFVKIINPNDFPSPLTKEFMLKEFYPKYLDFIVENDAATIESGVIVDTTFEMMIMEENKIYDIGANCVDLVCNLNASGENYNIFKVQQAYDKKLNGIDMLELIFKETNDSLSGSKYPFIVYKSNTNELLVFNEDGSIEATEISSCWEEL